MISIASKEVKQGPGDEAIFKLFSNGIVSARDSWVYDFNKENLMKKISFFCKAFNDDREKWKNSKQDQKTNDFVDRTIKWTGELENYLKKNTVLSYNKENIKTALYRPFVKQNLYFDRIVIHRVYQQDNIFPIAKTYNNKLIGFSSGSARVPFSMIATDLIPDYAIYSLDSAQFLPFYTFNILGIKTENITDCAAQQFTDHYATEDKFSDLQKDYSE